MTLTAPSSTAIEQALAAIKAAGWPDATDIDGERITDALVSAGCSPEQALHAFNAALARLVAERFRSAVSIDLDACTAHLLVLRQRDQVRHLSIDYVLTAIAAVYGSPFPPHDNNNLH